MKHNLDDFRRLTDKQLCQFLSEMANCCSYPDGGNCTLCPMHLYFGVENCENAEELYKSISSADKSEPIEIAIPKQYADNVAVIKEKQCKRCKFFDISLPFGESCCNCPELRINASAWYVAVQKEPKCIFFERMNPVADIFKLMNGMGDNQCDLTPT